MSVDVLLQFIEQYGYLAIFFLLWLGIVGLPVPDELVVATGGLVAALGYLNPYYAFLAGYFGVVSGLSIGFFLGRWVGPPILTRLAKKKKFGPYIDRSTALIKKYGTFSLFISYLLPVVRHLVPYVVAVGGMTFRKYALYSYTTGLVWALAFYFLGYFFGNHVGHIIAVSRHYGFITLWVILALIIGLFIYRFCRLKKRANKRPEGDRK
ncbi:DedA family protein [Brevibacillus laterosporus]|uniref:DedA family protein n=1 Tax=Brevibacillus laterosporus TaxID=1465 RepID=UPI000B9AA660|nr:DedA family protein [Brevibacillus laterosporus]MBG9790696.1 alkaline phosphatase [Brevibacillus laterosporus]